MTVLTAIVSTLLGVAFAFSGASKVAGTAQMRAGAEHLGFSYSTYRILGVLELAGALGVVLGAFVFWPLGVAAATGLFLTMVGAVFYHLRAKDPVPAVLPAAVLGILAAAVGVLQIVTR